MILWEMLEILRKVESETMGSKISGEGVCEMERELRGRRIFRAKVEPIRASLTPRREWKIC